MSAFAHAMSPFLRYHLVFSAVLTGIVAAFSVGALTHLGSSPFGLGSYETAAFTLKALHILSLPQLLFLPVALLCIGPKSPLLGGKVELSGMHTFNCLMFIVVLAMAWMIIGRTFVATELQLAAANAEDLLWLLFINALIPGVVHGIVVFMEGWFVHRPKPGSDYVSNGIV